MNWKAIYRYGLGDEREVVVNGQARLDQVLFDLIPQTNTTLLRIEPMGEQTDLGALTPPEEAA